MVLGGDTQSKYRDVAHVILEPAIVIVYCDAEVIFVLFFFFKQKTAYEMAQCDWSSDVCSSDLAGCRPSTDPRTVYRRRVPARGCGEFSSRSIRRPRRVFDSLLLPGSTPDTS